MQQGIASLRHSGADEYAKLKGEGQVLVLEGYTLGGTGAELPTAGRGRADNECPMQSSRLDNEGWSL